MNAIVADALVPDAARTSAAMVWTKQNKQLFFFREGRRQ